MTTPITALFIIPAEGDPHGLLAEGPCGARPPMMWQCWGDKSTQHHDGPWVTPIEYVESSPRRALVLAWDGERVPEGCDRADRALSTIYTAEWVQQALDGWAAPNIVGCTLIALDADGQEVAL